MTLPDRLFKLNALVFNHIAELLAVFLDISIKLTFKLPDLLYQRINLHGSDSCLNDLPVRDSPLLRPR
jgi:hypothetical protein